MIRAHVIRDMWLLVIITDPWFSNTYLQSYVTYHFTFFIAHSAYYVDVFFSPTISESRQKYGVPTSHSINKTIWNYYNIPKKRRLHEIEVTKIQMVS